MQLIADILSYTNNQEELSKLFTQTSIDWDAVVIVGSKHLMLPALYCKLKEKGLLPLIPDELNLYLEEITRINRGRNETLLAEAKEISTIFNKNDIDHVFIKGVSLLAGQTFDDIAERMIGDIDILVAKNQLHTAYDILSDHGYIAKVMIYEYQQKTARHLSRQISSEKLGAIELHKRILVYKYSNIITSEEVLNNKIIVDSIPVTSNKDSIKIAIMSLQINDKAHQLLYLKFKTIYDCLALNLSSDPILLDNLCLVKHSNSFIHISSVFFKELTPSISTNYTKLLKSYFIFNTLHSKTNRIISVLLYSLIINSERMSLMFNNKSYRKHILKNKIFIKKK